MSEYLTVWRFKVADEDVEGLVEVQSRSVAETKRLCPEMLSAELVNLGDGTWLHLVRWSARESLESWSQRLLANPDEAASVGGMHAYFSDEVMIGHGEIATAK
jgi:hypothetical protein